ncbi:MAG TPA: hypothetical protein RMH99_31955 [Sandaracinaceae bacterium LLY-WYZ-13_1]|nr:hypothetical protein [Sandaracinaceae bacterium LLY-WYZ-13_1]
MDAWPIEEVWLRPAVTPLVCAAVPFASERLVRLLLADDPPGRRRARLVAGFVQLQLAWWIGVTALGPRLVDAPDSSVGHAYGALCVLVAWLSGGLARRADDDRAARVGLRARLRLGAGLLAVLVPAIAIAQLVPWPAAAPRAALVAVALALAAVAAHRRRLDPDLRTEPPAPRPRPDGPDLERDEAGAPDEGGAGATAPDERIEDGDGTHVLGWVTGGAIGALLAAGLALPWTSTRIGPEEAPHAGASAAVWRLRIHPWDPVAMLAAGWASREREDYRRAVAQAREARRMGLPVAPTLELEAEVLAARGRCEEARATFDRALRARAARVFEEDALAAPLTLGGYQLPPTLVTECGGLEQLPGLGDLDLGDWALDDAERGDTDRGDTERGDTERGHTERGHTERGDTERGDTDRGDTDRGDTDRGNTDRGDTDRGDTDRGDTDRGDTDRGDTERSDTQRGDAERDDAERDYPDAP